MSVILEGMLQVLVISLAVATISATLSVTRIFKELRLFVKNHSDWFGHLIQRPYCTSHWVAMFFFAAYLPKAINGFGILDYVVTYFAIVALSAFWLKKILQALNLMEEMHTSAERAEHSTGDKNQKGGNNA